MTFTTTRLDQTNTPDPKPYSAHLITTSRYPALPFFSIRNQAAPPPSSSSSTPRPPNTVKMSQVHALYDDQVSQYNRDYHSINTTQTPTRGCMAWHTMSGTRPAIHPSIHRQRRRGGVVRTGNERKKDTESDPDELTSRSRGWATAGA